ncbi:hypothetical protein [Prevotella sp. tf2-5]|uniref:hypothetical protein n=1 Tax=Prevotella sp. tf2-5 TaxID=1761889 RepID=UPI0008E57F8F|nr:hypothetical protein [Prevotella sp. tf2-5]SFO61997.1 hypothetical protein SAMN04487852_103288 [Prevotella sp. tf2-5]
MSKKYCSIYSKLVQSEGDMVGHIAYSLYKAEKVRYIKEQKEAMKVEVLPDEIVQEFASGRDNQTSLDHYRGMAETILQRFIGGSFDDMSGQVIDEVTDRLTQHMDHSVLPLLPKKESGWKKFWNGVFQSVAGAIALSLIVWLFANVVGKFSLGNISVTYNDKDNLTNSEQVTTPPMHPDSIAIEDVKPQNNVNRK